MSGIHEIRGVLNKMAAEGHKYSAKVCDSPLYIDVFKPESPKIILVYNEAPTRDVKCVPKQFNVDDSTIEIGGTPLPAPFENDETFNLSTIVNHLEDLSEEEDHSPIPIIHARRLLSYCNLNMEVGHPVWVVTEGDLDLVSTWVRKSPRQIIRSWAKMEVLDGFPSIETLNATHQIIENGRHLSMRKYSCELFYDMVPLLSSRKESVYSKSTLVTSWNSPILEPPSNSSVSIVTKTKIGHGGGPIRFLWEQLVLIGNYLELLECNEETSVTLPNSFNVLGASNTISSNALRTTKIDDAFKRYDDKRKPIQNGDFFEVVRSLSSLNDINDKDILSKLWFTLISCNNASDYFACLYHLDIVIASHIHKRLKFPDITISSIGLAMANSSRLPLNPSDWKANVKLLVELGLEKIANDLFWVVSSSTKQCISVSQLGMTDLPGFTEVAPSEWSSLSQRWLVLLTRVHCWLEIVFATHTALNFSSEGLLKSMGNSVLHTIVKSASSPVRDITQLVADPVLEVEANLENKIPRPDAKPTRRVVRIESTMSSSKATSVFFSDSKCPFPWYRSKTKGMGIYFVKFQSISSA